MRQRKEEEQFQRFYGIKTVVEDDPEVEPVEITEVRNEDVPKGNASASMSSGSNDVQRNDDAISDEEGILDSDEGEAAGAGSERANMNKLTLRKFQEELAKQALKGNNSLIIAPTGSGKTVVAYEIMKHHLASGKSKSIIFLVSKTTLAQQQYAFFSRHMDLKPTEIAYLTGAVRRSICFEAIIKTMKLMIMTPQILINELNCDSSLMTFGDISMMIFDECHRTTKKHLYKVILDMMLDHEFDHPNHVPIQVVGITTSPGVGKGKKGGKATENLIMLLANLNVLHKPVTVAKNVAELKQHQTQIEESYVRVKLGVDKFTKEILKAMIKIEGKIEDKIIMGNKLGQFRKPPKNKGHQKYENWIMELNHHMRKNVYDRDAARIVEMYASHLKMYCSLLYLKKFIPHAINVTNSLGEFEEGPEGQYLRSINQGLMRYSMNATVPMLMKLLEILKEEYERSTECRCIILVPQRAVAPALADTIHRSEGLTHLQPKSLTGLNNKSGMAIIENSIKAFRDGKSKILIAHSVVEEGLDIPACNLVIMYNNVTGEVGRFQKRGRGRMENSRALLISSCGTEQAEREKKNFIRAQAMKTAIQDLQKLRSAERLRRIKIIQQKEREKRLNEHRFLQQTQTWRILCGQCLTIKSHADKTLRKRKPCYSHTIAPRLSLNEVAAVKCSNKFCSHYLGVELSEQHEHIRYSERAAVGLVLEDDEPSRLQTLLNSGAYFHLSVLFMLLCFVFIVTFLLL